MGHGNKLWIMLVKISPHCTSTVSSRTSQLSLVPFDILSLSYLLRAKPLLEELSHWGKDLILEYLRCFRAEV